MFGILPIPPPLPLPHLHIHICYTLSKEVQFRPAYITSNVNVIIDNEPGMGSGLPLSFLDHKVDFSFIRRFEHMITILHTM